MSQAPRAQLRLEKATTGNCFPSCCGAGGGGGEEGLTGSFGITFFLFVCLLLIQWEFVAGLSIRWQAATPSPVPSPRHHIKVPGGVYTVGLGEGKRERISSGELGWYKIASSSRRIPAVLSAFQSPQGASASPVPGLGVGLLHGSELSVSRAAEAAVYMFPDTSSLNTEVRGSHQHGWFLVVFLLLLLFFLFFQNGFLQKNANWLNLPLHAHL